MGSQKKEATILLVEDDEIDVMNIERSLRQLKVANPLIKAGDGVEALELLREPGRVRRPVVIILDLNMPRMGGIEFLEAIRQDKALANLVVFVMTTSNADEDKTAAYSRNIAGYIVKSGDVGEGFISVVTMLDHYWRIVVLPE